MNQSVARPQLDSRVLVVGAGHVGVPLALKLWEVGHHVAAVDIDESKIAALRAGCMPFHEAGCQDLLASAAQSPRFCPLMYGSPDLATEVERAEYVIMTLGTPLGTDYTFRFDQYGQVLDRLLPHLRRGVTLIVRSTVAPHFTRNVVTPRIATERDWIPGRDFFPSFCPERLRQGAALQDIVDLPEIIGSDDPETAMRAVALFRTLRADKPCHLVSTVEAELAKLFLNTFRYTMFGLANEFAMVAEEYGADVHRILAAANTDYPRGGIPMPGPSRGPCLGKDTAALAYSSTSGLIAHAAIKSNENLLLHVAHEMRPVLGSYVNRRVGILGAAFKANTDDVRDALTVPLRNLLDREGAHTAVYDPLVAGFDDPAVLRGCEAVVLMTPHDPLRVLSAADLEVLCGRPRAEIFVFDLWNVWPWADRILGKGNENGYETAADRRLRLADARGRAAAD